MLSFEMDSARPTVDHLLTSVWLDQVGISVDQLKNFFSNAKPKELKKQK